MFGLAGYVAAGLDIMVSDVRSYEIQMQRFLECKLLYNLVGHHLRN